MNRQALDNHKSRLGWKPAPAPAASAPVKPYINVRTDGDIAYISGHVAVSGGELLYKGRIGRDVTIEEAKLSAAVTVINVLDLFDAEYGLERVDKVLKMTGYLSCEEHVTEHPQIMNAASEILVDVFGEDGKHSRCALGIHTLPLGASVEIDMIVKMKPEER